MRMGLGLGIQQFKKLKKGNKQDIYSVTQTFAELNKESNSNTETGETRNIVAKKVGFGSHDTSL